jgi:hypothetical protein
VEVDVVVIESDDVAIAIAEEVATHGIFNKLVIGISSLSIVYILCTIIFLLLRTDWKWLLIFLIVPLLAYFSIRIMGALINKLLLIFVGNMRDYHLESQNALQHFVQSMLFRRESCLLCPRPIKKQMGSIKDDCSETSYSTKMIQTSLIDIYKKMW